MSIPLNKQDHIEGICCTERKICNAGIDKNFNFTEEHKIVIEMAINRYIPNAINIIVTNRSYYFESPQPPTTNQLSSIGKYISLRTGLNKQIKEYGSNDGYPVRNLFKTTFKNY